MKKLSLLLSVVFIFSILLTLTYCSVLSNKIGQVSFFKSDEEAIKDVVHAYFKATKNYDWESFDTSKGLEYWSEPSKKELLENPSKLPNLERSIKENKISRKLIETRIIKITIEGDKATVSAHTIEDSKSVNERFNGKAQTSENITLKKENNIWRITGRTAQVSIVQSSG